GLDRRGLVRVTSNPADGRERTIELSPAGWKLHSQISTVAKMRQKTLLSVYSAGERALLKNLLERLLDHIRRVDDDPVGRSPATRKSEKVRTGRSQSTTRLSSDRGVAA